MVFCPLFVSCVGMVFSASQYSVEDAARVLISASSLSKPRKATSKKDGSFSTVASTALTLPMDRRSRLLRWRTRHASLFSLVVNRCSLRVWRVLYSCVIVREGFSLLLHDLFYGNTFLCCLQQHRDHELMVLLFAVNAIQCETGL
jgi:hypothetical protein